MGSIATNITCKNGTKSVMSPFLFAVGLCRERKVEGGALARFRLDPDSPAVTLDDLLADRQADARACVLLSGVQASEDLEDVILELRVDADAVVATPRIANASPFRQAST